MRASKIVFALVFVLLLAAEASAEREAPPRAGTAKDFVLPSVGTFGLENGLEATLVPYGSLPKVSVYLVLRVGNFNETDDEVWLLDLAADLMKEGTTTLSSEEISERVAEMGGQLDISVGSDLTYVSCEVLSEFGPELVGLMADIVQNPLFPDSEIERLRRDMLRNISIQKSKPRPLANEKFLKVLYPDHAYGRAFPTTEMVESFTTGKIRSFYESNFGAARAHVYVAGRFDGDAVEAAVREAFAGWERGPEPLIAPPQARAERMIYILDRPGAPQSSMYIGQHVIDPSSEDFIGLKVANDLLGGSFISRITKNIREKKGFTYSPYSMISTKYRSAYWVEIADVGTEVTGAALKEVLHEVDRLRNEPPTEEELKGIQNWAAGIFVLQNASRGGIINALSFAELHGLGSGYLTNFVKNIYSLTPGDVRDMVKANLKEEEMVIVIAGDREKIIGEVSAFGPVAD